MARRLRVNPTPAHCTAQNKGRANQSQILDDILAFHGQAVRKGGPDNFGQNEERQSGAGHL
jgi:hypothetical protein